MKFIIYWLTLLFILPLFYLFWWKKKWRLALGVAIGIVLVIGFFLPELVIYSTLARKIKQEIKHKRQLEKELDDILDKSITQSDSQDQAKKQLEKEVKGLREKIMLLNSIGGRGSGMVEKQRVLYQKKCQEWLSKYGKENKFPLLLFSSEEFTQELGKEHNFNPWSPWLKYKPVENTIDFNNYRNSKPEIIKEKILAIIQKKDEKTNWELFKNTEFRGFPIICLKNIDQIPKNEELEELILALFDPAKFDLWKYQKEIEVSQKKEKIEIIPDLSKFIFLATTSTIDPKNLPTALRTKLNPVKPFLDQYFWIILPFSVGIEIIVFYWLVKSRKKTRSKVFKQLEY